MTEVSTENNSNLSINDFMTPWKNDLLLFGSIVHWENISNFDTEYYDEFELMFPELSPAEILQLEL